MEPSNIVYGGRTIARRPSQYDEYVLSDVFYAILPELAAECDWDVENTDTINRARAEFFEAARSAGDGYEIMRNLENDSYWDGNARLVEIFENAPFKKCLCEHVQKWIDYFIIEPLFKIGDVVTFQHGCETLTGIIEATESLFEPGMYVVYVAGIDGRPLLRWEKLEKTQGA